MAASPPGRSPSRGRRCGAVAVAAASRRKLQFTTEFALHGGDSMEGVAHVSASERIEGFGIDEVVGRHPSSQLLDLVVETQTPEEIERFAQRESIGGVQRPRDRRGPQPGPRGSDAKAGREARVAGDSDDRLQAALLDVELSPVLAGALAWNVTFWLQEAAQPCRRFFSQCETQQELEQWSTVPDLAEL